MTVKADYALFIIFALSLFFFTVVYYFTGHRSVTDAFYDSTMIQTLVGNADAPTNKKSKILRGIQAILAYVISIGIISFTVKKLSDIN